jgi:hypothetical protein
MHATQRQAAPVGLQQPADAAIQLSDALVCCCLGDGVQAAQVHQLLLTRAHLRQQQTWCSIRGKFDEGHLFVTGKLCCLQAAQVQQLPILEAHL